MILMKLLGKLILRGKVGDMKEYTLPQSSSPRINLSLARQRDLSEGTITAIQTIMDRIHIIHNRPLYYCETYKDAVECVQSLETTLQLLWGFPYDKNYQTYRCGFKECTCPKVDNAERVGMGEFVYDRGCVVHEGMFEEEDNL